MKDSPGLKKELTASIEFHKEGVALLISEKLLRDRFMGQIDLCRLRKTPQGYLIEVGEVKSSSTGEQSYLRGQNLRISSTQSFLSGLLGYRIKLIRIVG
jgi:hypothetical protein